MDHQTEFGIEKRKKKRNRGSNTRSNNQGNTGRNTGGNTGNNIRHHKLSGTISLILTIFLCVITLMALSGCLILLLENRRLNRQSLETMGGISDAAEPEEDQSMLVLEPELMERTYTEEELQEISVVLAEQAANEAADGILNRLKEQLVEGEDFSAILRAFYPNEVVVVAEGRYYFFPISDSLKKHSYQSDGFIPDNKDILTYQDEIGNVLSKKGIDVSRYQNEINWSKVAGDGVEFAFIRLGIRGSAEGTLVLDPAYEQNMEGAAANGIDTGVYFFTQALSEAEAVEEAEFVLENLEGYDITYPVVLDVEAIETRNPRTQNMTREKWTKVTIAFCERIKEAGYTPMIYGNLRSFMLMLDMEQLEQYEKWFAFFRTPIYFPYEHSVWQYTNKGRVDGIKGDVDLNVCMRDFASD